MKKNSKALPDISYAISTLIKYKREKRDLEARLGREREVWSGIYSGGEGGSWIFNSVINKHADVIESFPK